MTKKQAEQMRELYAAQIHHLDELKSSLEVMIRRIDEKIQNAIMLRNAVRLRAGK